MYGTMVLFTVVTLPAQVRLAFGHLVSVCFLVVLGLACVLLACGIFSSFASLPTCTCFFEG